MEVILPRWVFNTLFFKLYFSFSFSLDHFYNRCYRQDIFGKTNLNFDNFWHINPLHSPRCNFHNMLIDFIMFSPSNDTFTILIKTKIYTNKNILPYLWHEFFHIPAVIFYFLFSVFLVVWKLFFTFTLMCIFFDLFD